MSHSIRFCAIVYFIWNRIVCNANTAESHIHKLQPDIEKQKHKPNTIQYNKSLMKKLS